jgi:hypothetical protein
MSQAFRYCAVFFLGFVVVIAGDRSFSGEQVSLSLAEVVGITHMGGYYNFTDKDYLTEGADLIAAMGVHVIKLGFSDHYKEEYRYNSRWPENIQSMTDLAKTEPYRRVLGKPEFKTIVLEAQGFGAKYFHRGLSKKDEAYIKKEFYDVTRHLLTEYKGTGKTFVLQNWEGDGHMNMKSIPQEQRETAIQGMIDWLNARQDGIELARKETGMNGVLVVGAAEVNHVPNSVNAPGTPKGFDYPLVVDTVVPHTHMDLYSLSAWGPCCSPGTEQTLVEKLDYLVKRAPPSRIYGRRNIVLGEYGAPENDPGIRNPALACAVARKQLELALQWGVRYACYWELYCNGLRRGETVGQNGRATASQLRGVWLVRPDRSPTMIGYYLKDLCNPKTKSAFKSRWNATYSRFDVPAVSEYDRPHPPRPAPEPGPASLLTEAEDPGATVIAWDSTNVNRTGEWQTTSKVKFQERPTTFTRRKDATAKFPLGISAPSLAIVSIYRHVGGGTYDDKSMKVEVVHNGMTETLTLDCSQGATGWIRLGAFEFSGKGDEYVLLTRVTPDDSPAVTRAIAVRYKLAPATP